MTMTRRFFGAVPPRRRSALAACALAAALTAAGATAALAQEAAQDTPAGTGPAAAATQDATQDVVQGAAKGNAQGNAPSTAKAVAHGGQVRAAGPLQLELVLDTVGTEVRYRPLAVYVTDLAGQPVDAASVSGTVTLQSGKHRADIALAPDSDNRLLGNGYYAVLKDAKATVSISVPGQPARRARFTSLLPKDPKSSTGQAAPRR